MIDLPGRDPGLPRFAVAVGALVLLAAGWLLVRPVPALPGVMGTAVEIAASTPEAATEDPGATVFLAQGCGTCHSRTSSSTALGPGMGGVAARAAARIAAADYTGDARSAREYLEEAILTHCADIVPGYTCIELPDLGLRLSATDADALVNDLLRIPAEGRP